jgi:peptidoglycan/LPS O-acetylase OafA/YrhL
MKSAHIAPIKYRPEIDGLRALAVSMVIVVHAFPSKMRGGFIGVDVFFVISGFLIASIILTELRAGKLSFVGFYIRRANRIFPALVLVLLSSLIFGWFALFADEFKSLGRSTAAGAGFVANINLYKEVGYWDVSSKLKPLLHLWSLGVEEQFYFVFPCLLWITWKNKLDIVSVLLVCVVASGIWSYASMNSDQAAAFYLPLQRAWELLSGSILAYLTITSSGQRPKMLGALNHVLHKIIYLRKAEVAPHILNNVAALAGLSMILVAAFGFNASIPFPGRWSLLPVGGALLLIAAGSHAWINRVIFSNKIAVYIGLISFPLYLWHWPLLSFACIVGSGALSNRVGYIAVILSFVLASATYHFLEKPLRNNPTGRGTKALCLAILLALLGGTGFYIDRHEGIRIRAIEKNRSSELFTIRRPSVAWDESNGCFKGLPDIFKYNFLHGHLDGTLVHCDALRIEDVSMALVGDSNAGQFAYDLHARYKTSILTIHSSGRSYIREFDGDETSQAIIAFLLKQTQIKTIIISHLGVGLVQGEFPTLGTEPIINPKYEIGLKKTIHEFQDAGKRVILVLSIPILDFDPKRCQVRPFSKNQNSERCSIPLQEILQSHRSYLDVKKRIVTEFPNLEIIDPMAYLCDKQACYAKKGGVILYADRKHVNFQGSIMVTKPLIELIDRIPTKQVNLN